MVELVNSGMIKFGEDISLFQEQLEKPKDEEKFVRYLYTKPRRMLFMGYRAEIAAMGFCNDKLCAVKMRFGSTYEDFEHLRNRITNLYARPVKSKKSFSMKETVTWRYSGIEIILMFHPSKLYTDVSLSHLALQK
ncbi:MAG: hypothetical protein WD077_11105 [Bacteroidia bacterium]